MTVRVDGYEPLPTLVPIAALVHKLIVAINKLTVQCSVKCIDLMQHAEIAKEHARVALSLEETQTLIDS